MVVMIEKACVKYLNFNIISDLVNATKMAEDAINDKSLTNILPNVKLEVIKSAGGCSLDTVMRTFISYYIQPGRVLGVLGPPCSEAVEPIAGT